ncbi:MAG: PP2C family protein-serine/threonine phosphatase [Candidatus Kapaibacterium sp.]
MRNGIMGYHLLIVEDNKEFCTLLELALEERVRDGSLTLHFTGNGREALELVNVHPNISLVLTDISMPEMDGLTFLEQINAKNPHIKSIVISAHSNLDFLRRAMNAGASDYLVKPASFDDILESIDRVTERVDIVREALRSRDRLKIYERELSIAHDIQQEMLPQVFPAFPDRQEFDIEGGMLPARHVGGDFFDFFLVTEHRLGFVIGDVSGKGVSAALLMARARTLLRSHAQQGSSPAECMTLVNEALSESNRQAMFATVFLGILDTETGIVEYCNASHVNPVLRSADGRSREVCHSHAMAVGMLPGTPYETLSVTMLPGDTLVLMTDGITESHDVAGTQFGSANVLRVIDSLPDPSSAQEIMMSIVQRVRDFAEGTEQFDDIGILVVRYNGPSS